MDGQCLSFKGLDSDRAVYQPSLGYGKSERFFARRAREVGRKTKRATGCVTCKAGENGGHAFYENSGIGG